jgi:hypothetical protein
MYGAAFYADASLLAREIRSSLRNANHLYHTNSQDWNRGHKELADFIEHYNMLFDDNPRLYQSLYRQGKISNDDLIPFSIVDSPFHGQRQLMDPPALHPELPGITPPLSEVTEENQVTHPHLSVVAISESVNALCLEF